MSEAPVAGASAVACVVAVSFAVREARRAQIRERADFEASVRRSAERRAAIVLRSARVRLWVMGVAAGVLGWMVAGPMGAGVGLAAAAAAPALMRRRAAARSRALLEDQLSDAVSSMSAGVRAGLSLAQALAFAAEEGEAPLASSLRGIVDRAALGVPLGSALDRWCEAQGSGDARLVGGVLRLHRRSGGDLPTVLDALCETLRERRAAAREIRSLTAQARMSGAILGLLPIAFFAFLMLTSRQDMQSALRSPVGLSAIVTGLVMQGVAFVWIRHLLRVD